ncbi:hypothetical protein CR513_41077, partial [Mucuna pruriens]
MLGYETKGEDKAPEDRRKNDRTEESGAGCDKAVQSLEEAPSPPYQEASLACPPQNVVLTRAKLTPLGRRMSGPVITFTDRDRRRGGPGCDEPMVISVIAAEYKIERVFIDQGSSVNILYWTTAKKLGIRNLTKCQGALYGFAGERVPIKGIVELETTFGDRSRVRTIPVLYIVVDAEASYNIIIGRPTLNRLEAVVSTHHLCMKFPVGRTVATVWANAGIARRCYEDSLKAESTAKKLGVNVLDFDLDPRHFPAEERPHPVEDLKEV